MARIIDPSDDDDQVDVDNQVDCPRCGSPCCEIISHPRPGSWFARFGKARCNDCRIEFSIELTEEPGQPGSW